jgi:enhancing lycopene biosynthesis protein 2
LLAATLGRDLAPTLTIGNDAGTAAEIEKTGAIHQECPVTEFVVDKKNRIVSTPAYMLATRISEVQAGIGKCVQEVVKLI